MIRFLTYLLMLFMPLFAMSQVTVSGMVIDKEANEPLAGASVMVKDADGKIKKFATTKADGGFSMSMPSVSGCRLEVVMMSFAKQSLPLDSIKLPVTIYMIAGSIQL